MAIHQWFVIALNIAAFLGMVAMFASYGRKDVKRGKEATQDDLDWFAAGSVVDYRQHRKI